MKRLLFVLLGGILSLAAAGNALAATTVTGPLTVTIPSLLEIAWVTPASSGVTYAPTSAQLMADIITGGPGGVGTHDLVVGTNLQWITNGPPGYLITAGAPAYTGTGVTAGGLLGLDIDIAALGSVAGFQTLITTANVNTGPQTTNSQAIRVNNFGTGSAVTYRVTGIDNDPPGNYSTTVTYTIVAGP
ncbi:MAG: hypothetical protein M3R04_09585 [bacterium]|nr:hypothetical protein [bacterium]